MLNSPCRSTAMRAVVANPDTLSSLSAVMAPPGERDRTNDLRKCQPFLSLHLNE